VLRDNLLFIHVPKTAGTSIEHALFDTMEKCKSGLAKHSTYNEYKTVLPKLDFEKDILKFAVIRNPYDRFFSYYKRHIGTKRSSHCPKIVYSTRKRQHKFKELKINFSMWVNDHYVKLERILNEYAPKKVNKNIYKYYFGEYENLDCILLFENLKYDWISFVDDNSRLRKHLRGKYKVGRLPTLNSSKDSKKRVCGFSYDYYDNETLKIFEEYNKEDIDFYFSEIMNREDLGAHLKETMLELPKNTALIDLKSLIEAHTNQLKQKNRGVK